MLSVLGRTEVRLVSSGRGSNRSLSEIGASLLVRLQGARLQHLAFTCSLAIGRVLRLLAPVCVHLLHHAVHLIHHNLRRRCLASHRILVGSVVCGARVLVACLIPLCFGDLEATGGALLPVGVLVLSGSGTSGAMEGFLTLGLVERDGLAEWLDCGLLYLVVARTGSGGVLLAPFWTLIELGGWTACVEKQRVVLVFARAWARGDVDRESALAHSGLGDDH